MGGMPPTKRSPDVDYKFEPVKYSYEREEPPWEPLGYVPNMTYDTVDRSRPPQEAQRAPTETLTQHSGDVFRYPGPLAASDLFDLREYVFPHGGPALSSTC